MTQPELVPQPDGLYHIEHLEPLLRIPHNTAENQITALCRSAVERYPYDCAAVRTLAERLVAEGKVTEACQLRLDTFALLSSLMGDDELPELDWENSDNRDLLDIIRLSAIDHFLICDFEMCAAMCEMYLSLDPEDHGDITRLLLYCYIELGDWEIFDESIADLNEKSPETLLIRAYAAFRRGDLPQAEHLAKNMRWKFLEYYSEFTAEQHPADSAYLADIELQRPKRSTLARELWLQTEHLWAHSPEFIEFLKQQA